jgi:NADH dehydrogenase subunit M (EC 1.6.5.3)
MILAGVLLKLGGYGIFRVMKIISFLTVNFNYYLISFRLVGGLVVRFICFRQVDLKSLIAYSSVSHISLVIAGLLRLNW